VSKKQVFEETGYYTWMFSGSMMWSNVGTGGLVAIVIVFTLLPIWPSVAKLGLWYLSVTFLLATFSFLMTRLFCFLFLWIGGYDFWVFPRLFDESLGVGDSFKPTYTFEKGSTGQGLYRITMLLCMAGFVFWAITQPTEFDAFISTQRDFVDDLYSGNLLSDVAAHKENLVNLERNKRFPKIDQLLREMEEDEKEEAEAAASGDADADAEVDAEQEERDAASDEILDGLLDSDEAADADADDDAAGNNEDGEGEL
jgi:translocation protein SEC62